MAQPKRLLRSKKQRVVAGVCGGIAEFFNMDPTIIRLIWALVTVLSAVVGGVLAYVIAWVIIPED